MADVRSILVLGSDGAPLTSGVPTVQAWDRDGAVRTPPPVAHLAGGLWSVAPTDADEAIGTVVLVDFGAGALPRRVSLAVSLANGSNQFFVVHVEDENEALWAGAAPTVGIYVDSAGAARTPPALVPVPGSSTSLFALSPTAADLDIGVEGRIDGPADSAQPFWSVSSRPATPWAAVSPGPLRNAAYDVAQFLNAKTVGGQLLTLATNLFIGRMPDTDRAPSTPCVSVLNTGGAAPTPFLDSARRAYFRPSVQVMVRSAADSFATGEGIARGVVEWCHQRVVADYVSWFSRDSQPAYLGPDSDQHHVWVVNLDAEYDAELG